MITISKRRVIITSLLGCAAACAAGIASHTNDVQAAARCSYVASYPSAIGHSTYLVATALNESVVATVDRPEAFSRGEVPAQLMQVDQVTGYDERLIEEALPAADGKAVFVRYSVSPSCSPMPAYKGAFDSAGTNGLYVGRLRPPSQWIGGRPTFNIYKAHQFPLPQRFGSAGGHLVLAMHDTIPVMTAAEMFRMYRTLWAESVTVGDRSVETRIRRWIRENPRLARKQPTMQITGQMAMSVEQAKINATSIPFGGTYEITVIAHGRDTLRLFGQTHAVARAWQADMKRDKSTGIMLSYRANSYGIDMITGTEAGPRHPQGEQKCSWVLTFVDRLPVGAPGDSTWRARMAIQRFLSCAPPSSALHGEEWPEGAGRTWRDEPELTFRLHKDGRLTFDASINDSHGTLVVRGVRISTREFRYMQVDEWDNRIPPDSLYPGN